MTLKDCTSTNDGASTYFIQGEIVPEYGHRIVKDLLSLKNDIGTKKLKIVIHAQKGCYSCCNAIYDIIKTMPFGVECFALGAIQGAPMAIFMAGDKRYISESTRIFLGMSNKTFSNTIERDTYDKFLDILSNDETVDRRELKRLTERNASLTKEDCIQSGLIIEDTFPI